MTYYTDTNPVNIVSRRLHDRLFNGRHSAWDAVHEIEKYLSRVGRSDEMPEFSYPEIVRYAGGGITVHENHGTVTVNIGRTE